MFWNGVLLPASCWLWTRSGGALGLGTSLCKFINTPGGKFRALSHFQTLALQAHSPQKWCLCTQGTALLNVTIHNIILRRPDWSAAPRHTIMLHLPRKRRFGTILGYLATARNMLTKWRQPTEIIIITQLQSAGCRERDCMICGLDPFCFFLFAMCKELWIFPSWETALVLQSDCF